ncbi:O-antigen ligase family protein [Intrasporangium calvum]|uniref:O-antigen ligase family protein n=1 Tax=Intrasporangium calvum TaxID=53358 RepID=A0ABT5GHG3_9MICO|nr:O-antigen ligase family protein [Intrasporangium calvum]MDC5697685.1 O-antigen ligase family protein [Intrasporangium calvum]
MTAAQLREIVVRLALVVGLLGVLLFVGRGLARDPELPLLLAGLILFLGLVVADPALVPLVALPLLLVTARISLAGVDLAVSDALLAVALLPSLLVLLGGTSRAMRQVMWLGALYQVATLFTLVRNPYQANLVEWFHAGVLVLGAVTVGWALGRRGHGGRSLRILALTTLALALITLGEAFAQYRAGDFAPVEMSWPYQVQKNAIGTVFALVGVVLYVRPTWLGWSRGWSLTAFWTLVAALLTTQSRQGVIALAVAVGVLVMRRTTTRRRSKGILLALLPALVGVSVMVQDQVRSGNEFNSFFQRLAWFEESIRIWGTDPWFGVGLRWWYTDRFAEAFQPPNGFMDTLTSGGIIGLVAFIALLAGTWLVARRLDPTFGVLAELVLLARIVQSQFDLFWVAVQVSLPFLILGLCLGAAAHQEADADETARLRSQLEQAQQSGFSGRPAPAAGAAG